MFLREHPLCADPFGKHGGRPVAASVVDHVVPKRGGGADSEENWQPLCKACHDHKTAVKDRRWG
jgi:5-methylcytosine-specific restriction protein A